MNQRISQLSQAIKHSMTSYQNNYPILENQKSEPFTIKIANTLEEREAVFRLAYRVYLDKEYVKENNQEWLVIDYDQNPSTAIFIVKNSSGVVIASATLVFNDTSVLPTEKIYESEIRQIKTSGSKIVEVSRLVINPDFRNSKDILVLLFNYMFIYCYHVKHFDTVIMQVNPRHKDYYRKLLNFKEVGGEKFCPIVQNAPAILLGIPLCAYYEEVIYYSKTKETDKKVRSLYQHFLNPEQEKLVAYYLIKNAAPITLEEKLYFGFSQTQLDDLPHSKSYSSSIL